MATTVCVPIGEVLKAVKGLSEDTPHSFPRQRVAPLGQHGGIPTAVFVTSCGVVLIGTIHDRNFIPGEPVDLDAVSTTTGSGIPVYQLTSRAADTIGIALPD